MAALRCTRKLLKRLGIGDPGEPPPPRNRLGDWFANIIYMRQGHFVLLVSRRSLLPVVTTARDLRNLEPRFLESLAEVLSALGVPQHAIERELSEMHPLHYGRTNSASVLGSMNDLTLNFRYMLPEYPDTTPLAWSLNLAGTPCGPIGMERPGVLAHRLLTNPDGFELIDGGGG
jgi:hypothetical protein